MVEKKIDITSTVIEKGIDLIGGFIEKLAGSTLEEAGLIFGDKMRIRRLKNQIKIFSDAQRMAEENNIVLKQINLKALVPLLEFSSLEEDETLQQKWSNLILNFSDANKDYESSIFPFILNQLSTEEAIELDRIKLKTKINSTWFRISEIQVSNLKRLGLIDRIIIEGFTFSENENPPVYYAITEIGHQFIKCCSK